MVARTNVPPPDPRPLPTPSAMVAHLDRFLVGQSRAKRDLAVAVYNHFVAQAHRDRSDEDLGRQHVLLVGPTGTGKSCMVRRLAELLDVPLVFAAATQLVEVGYRGRVVDDLLRALLAAADNDPRRAERGIVCLDEIDKVRSASGEVGRDVSGEGVQNALLTLLDGRVVDGSDTQKHAPIDSGRVLFLCTGAFVGLDRIVQKRLAAGAGGLGFHCRDAVPGGYRGGEAPLLARAQAEDFVAFGFIPEFVGRFATITALHDLGEDDLRAILAQGLAATPLARARAFAHIHGIELDWTDDACAEIARRAVALGAGARGLQRLVQATLAPVQARWSQLADDGVSRVVVTGECAAGRAAPEFEHGPRRRDRSDGLLRASYRGRRAPAGKPATLAEALAAIAAGVGRLPFTDTTGWSDEDVWRAVARTCATHLDWHVATTATQALWRQFERKHRERPADVLRVAEELRNRKATLRDFYDALVGAGTDSIPALLHYVDFRLAKARFDAAGRRRGDGGEARAADAAAGEQAGDGGRDERDAGRGPGDGERGPRADGGEPPGDAGD